jgi:hypothetical protein
MSSIDNAIHTKLPTQLYTESCWFPYPLWGGTHTHRRVKATLHRRAPPSLQTCLMRHLKPNYLGKPTLISNASKINNAGENATLREKKNLNAKPSIFKRRTSILKRQTFHLQAPNITNAVVSKSRCDVKRTGRYLHASGKEKREYRGKKHGGKDRRKLTKIKTE